MKSFPAATRADAEKQLELARKQRDETEAGGNASAFAAGAAAVLEWLFGERDALPIEPPAEEPAPQL